MPFKFSNVCNLLDSLEKIETRDPPFLPAKRQEAIRLAVQTWFHQHRSEIDYSDDSININNGSRTGSRRIAILSCLFPRRRPDRVFNLQAARLTKIVGRCLRLNAGKLTELQGWKYPRNGDLGACVERVLKDSDIEPRPGVAHVEEVDAVLDELAGKCRFSSLELREQEFRSGRKRKRGGILSQEQQRLGAAVPEEILRPLYLKLCSSEAKWLTRMVLKDFGSVVLDDEDDKTGRLVMRHVHFLIPSLLEFQDDLRAAVDLLNGPLKCYPSRTDPQSEKLHVASAAAHLRPKVGLKVGNSAFDKARSIKHCVQMAGKRRWSVERKYDGEYCEIHIDLSKKEIPNNNILKIFSKSGKESTDDRHGVQETIRECLRLDQDRRPIKQKCILLAEMVAYSDYDKKIMEFHKIRKLVTRSGRRLGVAQDSQRHEDEHLMLVFFDILLVDDELLISKSQEERRQRLIEVVKTVEGRAIISESSIINFENADAPDILKEYFLSSIRSCHEGLVLKPCQSPYVNFAAFATVIGKEDHRIATFGKRKFIKLKKDFIPGLGDTADLVVIGGSYDARQSFQHRIPGLEFTSFYLACPEVTGGFKKGSADCPAFTVVGVIKESVCIPSPCMTALNDTARFMAVDYRRHYDDHSLESTHPPFTLSFTNPELSRSMQKFFTEPIVCEVLGSGFEKPSGSNTYMLRHPRILKVHTGAGADRTWTDAVSFEELQDMAGRSLRVMKGNDGDDGGEMEEEMQEMKALIERSMKGERHMGGNNVDSQDTVTTNTTTVTTCAEDAGMSQSWKSMDYRGNLSTRGEVNERKKKRCLTDLDSIVQGKNGEKKVYSYDNVANDVTEETQFYSAVSSTKRKAQEPLLPTPPTSSISSEGSSKQGTEKTDDFLQNTEVFQTAPLLLTSEDTMEPFMGQKPADSGEENSHNESFHTPPTIPNTALSAKTAIAAAVESCLNDKSEHLTARSPLSPKKRKQKSPGLCLGSGYESYSDSKSPVSQPKGGTGLNFISEKAYDPFAKVLSSVKSGIKGSGFGCGGMASHGCHGRDSDNYVRQEHQHRQRKAKTDRVHEHDRNDQTYDESRRISIKTKDIARSNSDDNILFNDKTTKHLNAEISKQSIHKPTYNSSSSIKLVRYHHHHHHHHNLQHNKNKSNICTHKPMTRTSTYTHACKCLNPPTLNLQHTTIHVSSSSLTQDRQARLKTLLARKHGSTIIIDNLRYWSRQDSEVRSEYGDDDDDDDDKVINVNIDQEEEEDEEDNNDDNDDDEVVLESQSHPGLMKVILVDGAISSSPPPTNITTKPARSAAERVVRPVIQELNRAGITSIRQETVHIWDWRVLRSLMEGGGGSGGGGDINGKLNIAKSSDTVKNNNNTVSPYYIGKLVCKHGRRRQNKTESKSKRSSSSSSSSSFGFVFERHGCFFI